MNFKGERTNYLIELGMTRDIKTTKSSIETDKPQKTPRCISKKKRQKHFLQ